MHKNFERFLEAWKSLAETEEINEATLMFFLSKNFGTSVNSLKHYKSLSLTLGFISANKDLTYSVDGEKIRGAFDSK